MHLLCVLGPPAVGKMTVGRALCDLTGRVLKRGLELLGISVVDRM